MKVKHLFLIIIIFLISGCTAEVNLNITNNKVNESVDITFYQNVIYSKDLIRTSFRNYIPAFAKEHVVDEDADLPIQGIEYYQKEVTDLGNGYRFNYSYDFDITDYENSTTMKNAFHVSRIDVNRANNQIKISTDSDGIIYFNDYPMLEEIVINIKTDYLVEENNADKVSNNTYTWVFTKDSKKSINMTINTEEVNNKITTNILKAADNSPLITVIIITIVLAVIIGCILLAKNKKNNKL